MSATQRNRATCAAIAAPSCQRVVTRSSRSSTSGASPRIQHQLLAGGAAGGLDQVVHHRQQPGDPLGRQLQDAAVVQAGDDLAIDDPRRRHAAALAQAQQDRQQRMPRAIDLDAEIEREPPALARRATRMSQAPTDSTRRGPKSLSIRWRQPSACSAGSRSATKRLPGFRGVAAAEHEHHAALRRLAAGHPHLHQAVVADRVERGGLAGRSRRTNTGPAAVSVRTNCRSSSNGTTAPS